MRISLLFTGLALNAFAQDTVTHTRQSAANVKGTKVGVTETYTTDSPKLLQDFLDEHPTGDNVVKVGPNQGFTFIIQAEGNQNAQINVNLYVTLEKAFVRLTREQKRALSLVTVHRDFVERRQDGAATFLSFNVRGVRIGDNMFVRVTKNEDYAYGDDDEYFFIAPKTSVAGVLRNAVQKVDPDDLQLEPGSDAELKHFGINSPNANDYLKLGTVWERNQPGCYPETQKTTAARNTELLARNGVRWEKFVGELNRKRAELGVATASRTLKPDLYLRYHPQHFAAREWVTPRSEMCSAEYLVAEWNLSAPVYTELKRIMNVPAGYPEGYSSFSNGIARSNQTNHAENLRKWNEAWTAMTQKGIKDPCYSQCYWKFVYDGASHGANWVDVSPSQYDIDENPPHRSLAEMRKHGITMPTFFNQALITGVNPYGGAVLAMRQGPYYGTLVPATELNAEFEQIDRYNRKARSLNNDEWSRFLRELRDADIPRSTYVGHRINGLLLKDPDETDFYAERRFFYHTPGTRQRLPKLQEETFEY